MNTKTLNGNQLKIIAMIAMTIDHLIDVIYPNYPTDWWIVSIHIIGRLAAPIFWFFMIPSLTSKHQSSVRSTAIPK